MIQTLRRMSVFVFTSRYSLLVVIDLRLDVANLQNYPSSRRPHLSQHVTVSRLPNIPPNMQCTRALVTLARFRCVTGGPIRRFATFPRALRLRLYYARGGLLSANLRGADTLLDAASYGHSSVLPLPLARPGLRKRASRS